LKDDSFLVDVLNDEAGVFQSYFARFYNKQLPSTILDSSGVLSGVLPVGTIPDSLAE
jgi:hypothetical protein